MNAAIKPSPNAPQRNTGSPTPAPLVPPAAPLPPVLYSSLVYWLCAMAPSAPRFVLFILIAWLIRLGMTAFFRVITLPCPNGGGGLSPTARIGSSIPTPETSGRGID